MVYYYAYFLLQAEVIKVSCIVDVKNDVEILVLAGMLLDSLKIFGNQVLRH